MSARHDVHPPCMRPRGRLARALGVLLCGGILVMGGAAPTASGGAPDRSLEEILDLHARALGGLDRIFAPRNLHGRGIVRASGLEGTIEAWVSGDDRSEKFRQEIDLGLIKMTLGSDGEDWWRVDNNGTVGDLGGVERDQLEATLYIGDYLYLRPDEPEGRVELAGTEMRDGVPTYLLRVHLPDGSTHSLWLDAITFLPYGYEDSIMGIEIFVRLGEYHDVGGIMIPYRTEMITENELFNQSQVFESIEVVSSIDPGLFTRPGAAPRDFEFAGGGTTVELPMTLQGNHVFVPVTVNDDLDTEFLLDTGAGASCLSRTFARRLGLIGEGELGTLGVGGAEGSRLAQLRSIRTGDLELVDQRIVILDLEALELAEGRPVDGILGYDFFRRVVVDLDYEDRVVRLYDTDAFRYEGEGLRIPISLEFNVPVVEATLDGRWTGSFIVDTGNAHDLLLHRSFIEEEGLDGGDRAFAEISSVGVGGAKEMKMIRMESVRLGAYAVRDPLVVIPSSDQGAAGMDMVLGNLGAGILRRFRVLFNYEAREMILVESPRYDPITAVEFSGLLVEGTREGLRVLNILNDSPASSSGLLPGDLIVELDGRPCGGLNATAFEVLLGKMDGRTVPLLYDRDGGRASVRLAVMRRL